MEKTDRKKKIEELKRKAEEKKRIELEIVFIEKLKKVVGLNVIKKNTELADSFSSNIPSSVNFRYDAIPLTTFSINKNFANAKEWLKENCQQIEIEKKCNIAIDDIKGWLEVEIQDGVNTIFELLNFLTFKNLIVYTSKKQVFSFFETEYNYQLFIQDAEKLIHELKKIQNP